MARDRLDFDPDCGDDGLTHARADVVIGRWTGPRELLRATGDDWAVRGHRVRRLAQVCAGGSTVESWLAAEPRSPDALVLRAATETTRAFHLAIAAGRGGPVDQGRVDTAVRACRTAAEACPADPTPWVSLLSVARLYRAGVRRRELARWWDELYRRDAYSMEGHLQVLHYYSARWHGSHGLMYDFARDAAGSAPPGCPLPVLVQYARVEEYRYALGAAPRRIVQHWCSDGAVGDVRRTWERWLGGASAPVVVPGELRDLNYLAHAACSAGEAEIAGAVLDRLGCRVTALPWAHTGDPVRQIARYRRELGVPV